MANEYSNKPVVFLEHDIDDAAVMRYNRWWNAYTGTGSAVLPFVMLDSGQQISNGWVDFYKIYKSMVENEINRPAKGEITAYAWREADKVIFSITVTNHSDETLDYYTNGATVHALVYEDSDDGVTSRIVRGDASEYILTGVPPGSSAIYMLETSELIGVDWEKLHYIALVDYRPGGAPRPFDILQATTAQPINISIYPNPLTFLIDLNDPQIITTTLKLEGDELLEWMVSEDIEWLTITPNSGSFPAAPAISVEKSKITMGWQPEETLLFDISSGNGLHFEESVEVKAFYGSLTRKYFPINMR